MTSLDLNSSKSGSVSLRIESSVLDGHEISSRVSLTPTVIHERGELLSKRLAAAPRRTMTLWKLTSDVDRGAPLEEHLERLLQRIEPVTDKLLALKECELSLFCGFWSETGQGSFQFETSTMSRIVALNIPLIICLYPPPKRDE